MRHGDEETERLLRRHFRNDSADAPTPAEPCPDAEMLAAYVDRSLSNGEAQLVEAHAADCASCTQMLAMLVDSDPEPATATVLDDEHPLATSPAPARAPRAEPPTPWWRWGFTIPALAAVLVLGVWLAWTLPGDRRADTTDVMARNEPVSRAEKASEAAPSAPAAPSESAPRPTVSSPPERSTDTLDALERRRTDAAPPPPPEDRAADSSRASSRAQAATATPAPETFAKAEDAVRDAAPAPPDPSRAAAKAAGPPAAGAAAQSAGAARAADAVQERTAAAQAQRGAGNERRQEALAFAPAPLVLTSGSGRPQWRITGTSIARSADGGTTWQADFEAPRPVTVGAIAADGTVWLGGRAGLVLRRIASGWAMVTSPAAVDVLSVTDVSAAAATVTLADGRRLRTADGGRTWGEP